MTADDARALVARLLSDIAPDTDPSTLAGDDELHSTLDLDSMDVMNLVTAVSEETGRDIPDRDAAQLRTMDDWAAYLTR